MERLTAHRRSWPIYLVLLGMATLQVSLAAFSLYVLSSVRAYVAGESLYSKGQKDAQLYLAEYADSQGEEDYRQLMRALSVPIADRRAREELQKVDPDLKVAYDAFIAGGNHPDDIPGLIRLFRWFSQTALMSDAIATWTAGDAVIEQMRQVVEDTHTRVRAGHVDAETLRKIRTETPLLNRQLTELESKFSEQLGDASRKAQQILLVLNGLLAVLVTLSGMAFVRHATRVQARTEDEVVRRQESLQSLLDSAAEGLFGMDNQGRCTFVNGAALRMLGYDNDGELLGRRILDLIQVPESAEVPAISHGHVGQYSAAERYRRRDGSEFPVEHWSYPMRRGDQVEGVVTTFFDISERIRLRKELERREIVMERLIAEVSDGVITYNQQRQILLFNGAAEKMFELSPTEAIGRTIDGLFDEEGALPDADVLASGALFRMIGRRSRSREPFHIEASASLITSEGNTLHTIVLRDVTAREVAMAEREAREALEASNRAKNQFLSRMSHELRTPLNAVIGFAQLLRSDARGVFPAKQVERIDHIQRAGAHLLALVNDVLDLSRIESGEMAVAAEAIELALIADDAATMVSPLVTEVGVELVVLPSPQLVWVKADPVRLRQVLVNLLSNAVKYNRPGGRVSVGWQVVGDVCQVTIADTGVGIPPEKLSRLFEPFNRLGAESSTVEGTGIGLALARRLTELMEGDIEIASAVGEGTTATLTLRLAGTADAAPDRPQASSGGKPKRASLEVLYAEDNEVNAELVRQIVALRPGVKLRVATSGAEAISMAAQVVPDLMFVDMNLGDMSGIDLTKTLLGQASTRGIELIALSADALPEQIHSARLHGIREYLTKPVDFRELLALLDRKLRTR